MYDSKAAKMQKSKNEMKNFFWIALIGLTVIAASSPAADILVDDFSSGTVAESWRIYENTIDTGWRKVVGSAWAITNGVAQNNSTTPATGYPDSRIAEAPIYNFFSGTGTGTTNNQLTLSFDYSVAAGDSFYVANSFGGVVVEFSLPDFEVLRHVAAGHEPDGMAIASLSAPD